MKPFLIWAGNKYSMRERIKAILPSGKRLIEPFVGSGAVFLNTEFSNYLLADSNVDLINLYNYLKRDKQSFINYCRSFFTPETNTQEVFNQLRDQFNQTQNHREKSALFVYLNRHCFGGIWSYNSKGKLNSPFGKREKRSFPENTMQQFYQKSHLADFKINDFATTMQTAKRGDIIYCDPPYVISTKKRLYTATQFNEEQQIELAHLAEELAKKGVTVVISNLAINFTEELYKNANIITFKTRYNINRCTSSKKHHYELLAIFN